MRNINEENNLYFLLNKYNIEKDKYIIPSIDYIYINRNNLINEKDNDNDKILDLTCPICFGILNNPISCLPNKNAHSFCKECIDKYLEINNKCPICKKTFEYKYNVEIKVILNKLNLKCHFYSEGCKQIINYSDYINHIKKCEYNNITYECEVEKYNYLNKKFEKCKYIGDKNELESHFKICAFYEYTCIFCDEKII